MVKEHEQLRECEAEDRSRSSASDEDESAPHHDAATHVDDLEEEESWPVLREQMGEGCNPWIGSTCPQGVDFRSRTRWVDTIALTPEQEAGADRCTDGEH